jgi:tricorn protease
MTLQRLRTVAALAFFALAPAAMRALHAQDAGTQVRFARLPAVSPDGRTLAFSWRGDIWTAPVEGGAATRLTVHQAYDAWPVFSNDGRRIAFSSNRDGNDDVFVTTVAGGTPTRLTWHSGADQPTDWASDDQAVILQSRRQQPFGREAQVYRVPVAGGLEQHLMQAMGGEAALSPDGRYVVFTRGSVEWWRQRYRGAANTDLWLLDTRSRQFRRLTTHEGNDSRARFAGDARTIVYRSDESGAFNVWKMNVETGAKTQLTRYRDEGIRFPTAAKDAPVVVYEYQDRLWRMPLAGGAAQEIALQASGDDLENNIERTTLTRGASDFAPATDGRQAAIIARGELFVYDLAESGESQNSGEANRVTATSQRERDPRWSPDGRWLYFVSDRGGQEDVYRVRSADSGETRLSRALHFTLERLTSDALPERSPIPSPDGRTVAFVRGNGDLWLMDADGRNQRRLVPGWDTGLQVAWSPDSRWIAYAQGDVDFNEEVWIVPADASRPPVNVSQHPDNDNAPAWSPDGRFLVFASRRQGDEYDLWRVALRAADFEMSDEALRESVEGAGARRAGRDSTARRDSVPPVVIDFEGIEDRVRRMTTLQGDESSVWISPDSKTYLFSANNGGGRDLWTMKWDGTEAKAVTRGGANPQDLYFNRAGTRAFWRTGRGEVQSAVPAGTDLKTAAYRARMTIDLAAERVEKYEEAWRTMRYQFHDSTFGGSDFDAVRAKYRIYVPNAFTIEDFNAVVQMVLGELNGSHLGIGSPAPDTPPPGTGALGVLWDESYRGPGARVARVVPRGPASRAESRLNPGDVVLAVDGDTITATSNAWEPLLDKVNRRVLLTVAADNAPPARGAPAPARGAAAGARDLVIRPISVTDETSLIYDEWVARRRAIVDSLSNGRLAYLHIRGMSQPSLEQFERELYSAAHGREGLLVDVRWNGGGSTADLLLAILNVRRHAYTIGRGAPAATRGYPQDRLPLSSWTGPKGLLCNQFSFSNAEIFCHAWRALEMGPIVGAQTFGAVISTGATTLIDGSSLRLPFRSWYTMDGTNMELHGALPTVPVAETPETEEAGADPQLVRLVQEMRRGR